MCNLYDHSVGAADLTIFAKEPGVPSSASAALGNFELGFAGADADEPVLVKANETLTVRQRRWSFPSWQAPGALITNMHNQCKIRTGASRSRIKVFD